MLGTPCESKCRHRIPLIDNCAYTQTCQITGNSLFPAQLNSIMIASTPLIFLFILSANCTKLQADKSHDITIKAPVRTSITQDDFYITSFLQDQLDTLSSDQQCWLQPGVTGLRVLLQGNISQPPASIRNFALGTRNISSSGNVFSIDFVTDEFLVNGVSESTFLILGLIHRTSGPQSYPKLPLQLTTQQLVA